MEYREVLEEAGTMSNSVSNPFFTQLGHTLFFTFTTSPAPNSLTGYFPMVTIFHSKNHYAMIVCFAKVTGYCAIHVCIWQFSYS